METTKQQVKEAAISVKDDPTELICFYINQHGDSYNPLDEEENPKTIIQCTFDELPERKFDGGFGGTEGEPVIAFSAKYVYIKVQYDGAEYVTTIPRSPKYVGNSIPWPGG